MQTAKHRTWTRPLKRTLQLLVGRNTQSSISGKQFSRGIIWRHVWTTYLIFKIRTRQIDGEIPHQQQCLTVNWHTCQLVNTGRESQTIILRKWWIQQRQRNMVTIQFATMLEWGELNYYQAPYIIKTSRNCLYCVVITMNLRKDIILEDKWCKCYCRLVRTCVMYGRTYTRRRRARDVRRAAERASRAQEQQASG